MFSQIGRDCRLPSDRMFDREIRDITRLGTSTPTAFRIMVQQGRTWKEKQIREKMFC